MLERALAEVARLPDEEQEAIACLILEEMEIERGWDERFLISGHASASFPNRFRPGQGWLMPSDRLKGPPAG